MIERCTECSHDCKLKEVDCAFFEKMEEYPDAMKRMKDMFGMGVIQIPDFQAEAILVNPSQFIGYNPEHNTLTCSTTYTTSNTSNSLVWVWRENQFHN